jgi:uncharacterized membrane protein YfcA
MTANLLMISLFFLVALCYAMVGFGGGSTYNALLVLTGFDYQLIPSIALTCNILVTGGGIVHFRKAGVLDISRVLPFFALSVPMAYLGGRMAVSESVFIGLLGVSLLATGILMLLRTPAAPTAPAASATRAWMVGLPVGAVIGLLAGIVGIGGGIFLAPFLYLIRWDDPRRIALTASAFILVNSVAGLSGQLLKQQDNWSIGEWVNLWPLFVAVIIGGQLGSRAGAFHLPEVWIKRLTAVLVLYVAVRLLFQWNQFDALH